MAPRAIALDNEALRVLQLAGIEDSDFETVAIPYVRMHSPWLGEFGRINTLGQIDGHPKLVTFYQPELEAALRRRASQYGGVHTALGVALTGFVENADGVVATLEAGDGATSDGARPLSRRRGRRELARPPADRAGVHGGDLWRGLAGRRRAAARKSRSTMSSSSATTGGRRPT